MRVGFNGRLFADHGLRGWNRYTINLVENVQRDGVQAIVYASNVVAENHLERLERAGVIVRIAPAMSYKRWLLDWLPVQCKQDKICVFHNTYHLGLSPLLSCPKVVTLHDAIDVDDSRVLALFSMDTWKRKAAGNVVDHIITRKSASAIVTVSEYSRRQLMHAFGLRAKRISVVYAAADPIFKSAPFDPVEIEGKYLFYVGGFEERKNVDLLIKAFALAKCPDLKLVLAGRMGGSGGRLQEVAQRYELGDRCQFLGEVKDEDLPALYSNALAFVYPSLAEGFGLQLCEAMDRGCPVLASNSTSLPEVLGDGGQTFDARNPGQLAGYIEQLVNDTSFRRKLVASARRRATVFSWSQAANEMLSVYEKAMGNRGC